MTFVDVAMLVGGVLLVPVGLWAFAMMPKVFLEARRDDAEATRASGRVIELTEEPARGSDVSASWHPVVRFEDEHGHEHTIQARYGTVPSKWTVGDEVTVSYPPSAPEEAEIDHWFMAYQSVLIALLIGLVFSGAGTLLVLVALFGE